MPSSLEFMIAALAANSVVGGSDNGVAGLLMLKVVPLMTPGLDGLVEASDSEISAVASASPFTRAFAMAGFPPNGDDIGNVGSTFTGIMTTFLKEVKKSLLSAWRLTLDIYIDCIDASCSESCFSQLLTSELDLFLKYSNSSFR